jgi:uncharacterized protein (DUF2141 family)
MMHSPRWLAALLLLLTGNLRAADLTLEIGPVRSATGTVNLSLYNQAEGFKDEAKAFLQARIPAKAGALRHVFTGLPAGRYAVIAYHDENGDGKMNRRFGMIPEEGYGVSNNPELFGPPKFDACAFDLKDTGSSQTLLLKY